MRRLGISLAAGLVAAATAAPAAAQDDRSRWGISGGAVPQWEFASVAAELLERQTNMTGQEFTFGVVRGRDAGGDWGIEAVYKPVADDSVIKRRTICVPAPSGPDVCTSGAFHSTRGASWVGLQVHKFMPFVTIRRRVQIGLNLAGGIAWFRGSAEEHQEHLEASVDPATGALRVTTADRTRIVPFRDILRGEVDIDMVPLARVEGAAAVLLAPGAKLRFGAGVNAPGYHYGSVTLTYLFGSR